MKITSTAVPAVVALSLLAVVLAFLGRSRSPQGACCSSLIAPAALASEAPPAAPSPAPVKKAVAPASSPAVTVPLPRLLDLGAGRCIPCKMMAPILEDMKKEYAGQMQVDFIDVWENPEAGKAYGIRMIPVQIFFDARGKELFRHEGFFPKAEILAKWKELGIDFAAKKGGN